MYKTSVSAKTEKQKKYTKGRLCYISLVTLWSRATIGLNDTSPAATDAILSAWKLSAGKDRYTPKSPATY